MLQIKGVSKVYKTGSLVQTALKDVSLSLRDNEFVAILGPSGSGKTTLLNIIGGLDRYDEGDLIINGISTKKYSERDWDSYRNHTVGFVFQSYNLIPHQTILKNVELALTISGISSKERASRAEEALEKVGLKEHIHKKPSQLSGGQMQRVAIARALVNDPDILLADEPTGALDSETSLQVMDLLKEVAGDRLVVMVTHNPELAENYATRIVTLMDGLITSDSDPYTPEADDGVHKNMGRSSMSFLTALALSFNNLRTKKARTILVSFAGSIGIIGIALILSLSHGANEYIHRIEEESLQSYPLTINDTNINFSSLYSDEIAGSDKEDDYESDSDVTETRLISGLLSGVKKNDLKSLRAYFESDDCDIYDHVQSLEYSYKLKPQIFKEYKTGYRQVNPDKSIDALGFSNDNSLLAGMVSSFSTTTTFNPLPANEDLYVDDYDLKIGSWPKNYKECVVVLTRKGKLADMILYNLGLKDPAELDELISAYSKGATTDVNEKPMGFSYEDFMGIEFKLLPASSFYTYDKQYKVWTDRSEDKKYMNKAMQNAETIRVVGVVQPKSDNMSPLLTQGLNYHPSMTDHLIEVSKDTPIVKAQLKNPKIDVFTGKPFGTKNERKDMDFSSFFTVDQNALNKMLDIDLSDYDLPSIDTDSLDLNDIDLSDAVSEDDFAMDFPSLTEDDIKDLFKAVNFTITANSMKKLFNDLIKGYTRFTRNDGRANYKALPEAFAKYLSDENTQELIKTELCTIIRQRCEEFITVEYFSSIIENVMAGYPDYLTENELSETIPYSHLAEYLQTEATRAVIDQEATALRNKFTKEMITADDVTALTKKLIKSYETYADANNLPTVSYLIESFTKYLATDDAKNRISSTVSGSVDTTAMQKTITRYTDMMSSQIKKVVTRLLNTVKTTVSSALQTAVSSMMSGLSDNMLSAFNFDVKSLSDMIKFNMSAQELKDLMASLLSTNESSYENNLRQLGYADVNKPTSITIYPKDYDSKNHIKDLIEDYNNRALENGEKDKVIEYTDLVDALMGSITTIIDVISYILIAFVAISLVVSSIMIGVITYISVLERRKEIGILRAIGASKHNVSSVFNAETFIIGALAGVIGIGMTELLIIPINIIIHHLSGQNNINAILPPVAAFILIGLSILLTLIGGIIPSRKAAKSDPVSALRSE